MFELRLILACLAAPIAWTLHLLLSYFLVTAGCGNGWPGMRILLLLTTLLFAAGAVWPAFRVARTSRGFHLVEWLSQIDQQDATPRFLSILGLLITAVFLLAILLGGIGPLLVPVCGHAH
jgi:hypothetical protein